MADHYIDDCIVWSSDPSLALIQYEKVFARAVQYGLQFKPTKCTFFFHDLEILGHRITPEGRFPTNKGTEAILAMPRPHNIASVKHFLGMVGYFRDYAKTCPLTQSTFAPSYKKVPLFNGPPNTNKSLLI